jgi:predicted 3-demethylubiquinone-9 3-methyltransferase (glyoxalase superfamily)
MQKIKPCLWFDTQAAEAADYYTSLFRNSTIHATSHYPAKSPGEKGEVMTVHFTIDGQEILALNAGPMFKFSEAVSLVVNCENQEEIDHYWNRMIEDGGEESQCGWLKDKFGFSWQIVPTNIGQYFTDLDPERRGRAMQKLMKMKKIVIADLAGL